MNWWKYDQMLAGTQPCFFPEATVRGLLIQWSWQLCRTEVKTQLCLNVNFKSLQLKTESTCKLSSPRPWSIFLQACYKIWECWLVQRTNLESLLKLSYHPEIGIVIVLIYFLRVLFVWYHAIHVLRLFKKLNITLLAFSQCSSKKPIFTGFIKHLPWRLYQLIQQCMSCFSSASPTQYIYPVFFYLCCFDKWKIMPHHRFNLHFYPSDVD